ncbi:MAG TPA: AMP-binding protein [Polyangiaceae bacterium]|nr:AMP-binding protein [Polyangiaceae bacterium]
MNAYQHFATRFLRAPERLFLEDKNGATYTYADLDRETARIAALLARLGLSRGARVAAQVDKSPQGLFLYLGVLRAGFCFLPLNTAYQEAELAYFLRNAEPEVVICRPDAAALFQRLGRDAHVRRVLTLGARGEGTLIDELENAPPPWGTATMSSDDPAVLIYTSGTTGRSKGAVLTHGNLTSNADVLCEAWHFTADDVLIHALPIFHVHGLFVALHPLICAGARLLLHRKFDPKQVLDALPRATVLMGVPTFYTRLLAERELSREHCSAMRLFTSGSAPLLEATFRAFAERTGHTILERYGMSEAGMITSNPYAGERRAGTVGKPLPGVTLRVAGENARELPRGQAGDIEIRGANVFAGYLGMPEQTRQDFTADGYFKTGDVGMVSEDGYVSIVGRSKDIVISGGYNVYPKEIELVLDAFAEVEESAVVGVPHEDLGEAVTAVVVLKAGCALTELEMIARLKPMIAAYKVPRRVHVVQELPRNAMGKVEKKRLREQLVGPLGSSPLSRT